jgi:hypothetical protein
MHKEFVPPGQMVNGKFYWNILRQLRENTQHKCPDKWRNNNWDLRHDNVLAHASLIVRLFLASMMTKVIPHPSYSLDLAIFSYS